MSGTARPGPPRSPARASDGAERPSAHRQLGDARARIALPLLLASLIASSHCQGAAAPDVDVIDLVGQFADAETRPSSAAFTIADYAAAGVARPSIVSSVPSRLTWTLRLPGAGSFRAYLHVDGARDQRVGFRVGIADDRVYETLAHVWLPGGDPGWTPLVVDLSRYAGRKWSLFYRPDARRWRLVLSLDAATPSRATAIWGGPAIATDTTHARAYASRITTH